MVAQSLQQVRCLTDRALGLLKHVEEKPHLTEQAALVDTRRRSVVQGEGPYDGGEVKELQKRVCVRVRDVNLEPGVCRPIVVPRGS